LKVSDSVDKELNIQDNLDLRYMQVEMSLQAAEGLPGSSLPDSFFNCEFVTLIETTKSGMICYVKFEFNDITALDKDHGGLEILEMKSVTKNSALAKVLLNGPVAMMFCGDNDVWWVNPTSLKSTGLSLTIRGTRAGLTRIREGFSQLVGNGFTVKLGAESLHSPEYRDLLPEKQRLVLDKAIEMGYYSRPRGCTQRDIAQVMDIKQATVSEHLQSAESKIIHSLSNNVI
jgi:hypothetical protein